MTMALEEGKIDVAKCLLKLDVFMGSYMVSTMYNYEGVEKRGGFIHSYFHIIIDEA